MKIPPSIRTDILINHGYSRKEIREVSKEATIIRRSRIRSIETLHKDSMDEKVELMKRMLWKPFKSKKQREEERLMKEFYASKKEFYDYHSDLRDQLDGENGGGVVEGAEGENGDGESNKKSVNLVDLDTTKRTMNHRDRQDLRHHSNDQVRQQKNVLDPNYFVFHFNLWNILLVNIYFFYTYITHSHMTMMNTTMHTRKMNLLKTTTTIMKKENHLFFFVYRKVFFFRPFFNSWGNHDESE